VRKATKVQLVRPATRETRAFWGQQERGEREVPQVRWETKGHKAHKDLQEKKA
jgi:hypothetical protein